MFFVFYFFFLFTFFFFSIGTEKKALSKLLQTPIVFTKEEERIKKTIDSKALPNTKKEQANQIRELAQLSCPNQYKSFLSCYQNNGNLYRKCLKETKTLLFCTGQFLSKVSAQEIYQKIKEQN